jgi:Ser/Thr protein kinase RdoA (MazF antagonist)
MLSLSDQSLIQREVDLPGLGLVLDEAAFAAVLSAQYPDLDLRHIQKTYLRYKPATNCIVSYKMAIGEKTVLGYAKVVAHSGKVEKYRHRPGKVQDFGIGRIVLESERIIFSVLPNDNVLKHLPRLWNSAQRQLKALLPEGFDLAQATLHPLRYKPERRYVAQLRTGDRAQATIKAYTPSDYAQACLNATAFHGTPQIAPLLGQSDEHHFLVFPWIEGISLAEQINHTTWETLAQAGKALALLHQQNPTHLKTLTRSDEAAILLTLAADLTWLCPKQKQRIQTIAIQLSTALFNLPALHIPIHGDFNAEQVLLLPADSANPIALIDFDRAIRSDPATDLGSFIAKLEREECCGRFAGDRREQIASILIAGYRSIAPDLISDQQIQLYRAFALFRLAADPFRYCEPDWLEKMSSILDRIEHHLSQLSSQRFYLSCPV